MKKLGIFCHDYLFSEKLADYLSEKVVQEYCVVVFRNVDEVICAAGENKINLLLTEEMVFPDISEDVKEKTEKIICLTESRENRRSDCICMYKYGPVSAILPEILTLYDDINTCKKEGGEGKLTAVFSPLGGIGTTSFSLAYAREKSMNSKVLFLCMKPFSTLSEMLFLDDKFSITEAIYSYITEKEKLYDLQRFIQKGDGFDIISPARSYVELNSVNVDNWKEMLTYVKRCGEYNEIVIELSSGMNAFTEIFMICEKVLVLKREGNINRGKMEVFTREIKQEITEKIHNEKFKYIDVPMFEEQEDVYESIETTDIGRWLKRIVGEI